MPHSPIIRAHALTKEFSDGGTPYTILNSIDFAVEAGVSTAIIGPSGSGKSTLLHILGGVDKPTSGEVYLNGCCLSQCDEEKISQLRNQYIGFVYQSPFLMKDFTVLENIMIPILLSGKSDRYAREQAQDLLVKAELQMLTTRSVLKLSGGEKQRVSILRAVANQPGCILADEPTGHLDQSNAIAISKFMLSLVNHFNMSLVLVTHDMNIARMMQSCYELETGTIKILKDEL